MSPFAARLAELKTGDVWSTVEPLLTVVAAKEEASLPMRS